GRLPSQAAKAMAARDRRGQTAGRPPSGQGRFVRRIAAPPLPRANPGNFTWRGRKNRQCACMTQENQSENQTQAKAGAMIVPVTLFEQNCTIIWCEATKKAVVIDPGGDVPKIQAAIKETGVTVEKIWITHGHIDHVG